MQPAVSVGDTTVAASWSNTYGSGGAYDIIQTADGNYAAIGTCQNSTGNYWLLKLDGDGNVIWNQSLSSYFSAFPKSIVQTSDGGYVVTGTCGYVVGASINGLLLVKTDDAGNIKWQKTYGNNLGVSEANCAIQTLDGGYAIVGDYGVYNGPGGWDFLFIKTDQAGNQQWFKTFQGPDKQDDDRADCIIQTSDRGYVIVGSTSRPGNTPMYWLLKTDSSGVPQWNQTFTQSIWNWPYSVVQTRDGGYAVAGLAYSEFSDVGLGYGGSFWLIKTDASGSMQWNKNYGSNSSWVSSVVQTADGGYALAGRDEQFQLVKTNANGDLEWTYNGGGWRVGNSVIEAKDGSLLIAGQYNIYYNPQRTDMFYWVAKIAETGTIATDSPTNPPIQTPLPTDLSLMTPVITQNPADDNSLQGISNIFGYSLPQWLLYLAVAAVAIVCLTLGYLIGVRKTKPKPN